MMGVGTLWLDMLNVLRIQLMGSLLCCAQVSPSQFVPFKYIVGGEPAEKGWQLGFKVAVRLSSFLVYAVKYRYGPLQGYLKSTYQAAPRGEAHSIST